MYVCVCVCVCVVGVCVCLYVFVCVWVWVCLRASVGICGSLWPVRLPKTPKVPELEVTEVTGRAAVTSVPSSHYDSYTIPIRFLFNDPLILAGLAGWGPEISVPI